MRLREWRSSLPPLDRQLAASICRCAELRIGRVLPANDVAGVCRYRLQWVSADILGVPGWYVGGVRCAQRARIWVPRCVFDTVDPDVFQEAVPQRRWGDRREKEKGGCGLEHVAEYGEVVGSGLLL